MGDRGIGLKKKVPNWGGHRAKDKAKGRTAKEK